MGADLARFIARTRLAGIDVEVPLRDRLLAYYELLARWNRTINLTSLQDPDEAIDRLLVEPLVAAAALPRKIRLIDLGSGGGSPAIPLALSLSAQTLVMVESRSRKAAFLREAIRVVEIPGATVEAMRFQDLSQGPERLGSADLVSMRAVRLDDETLAAAAALLARDGLLALFGSAGGTRDGGPPNAELTWEKTVDLLPGSELRLLRRK